jgi:uncharacterized protein (TIGR03067 family)
MRVLSITAILLFAVVGPLSSDEVKDREPLQGTWKLVSINSRGKESELALEFVFKGDGITLRQPGKEEKEQFRFAVDPTVTPKAIDVWKSTDDGKRAEKFSEGVYEAKGNELKICIMGQPGPPWVRPAALEPAADSSEILIVLRKD